MNTISKYLIDNWREAPKMLSFWACWLAIAWGTLSLGDQTAILEWAGIPQERVPAVIGGLVLLARFIKQKSVSSGPPEE